jgi:acyl-coenzyme A thioesterase PaaI-like protein
MRPTCFYEPDGAADRFRATAWTRGPWRLDHQHGGPPAALLARAVEAALSDRDCPIVRFTVEFLRPVPIGPLRVETEALKRGRLVERYAARLWSGDDLVLTAVALCLHRRQVALPPAGARATPPPPPEAAEPYTFPFFPDPIGYHTAVDVRYVRGAWGQSDVTCWMRQRCPLVLGEAPTPWQRILVAADAGHGVAVPVPLAEYTFLNADLSARLVRPPRGEWIGLESRSVAEPSGIGLCRTRLWDADGVVGRAAQSLVVAARA